MEIKKFIEENRRRLIFTICALILTILLVVALVVIGNTKCKYQLNEPQLRYGDSVDTIISQDYNALLRISSYFLYVYRDSGEIRHFLAQEVLRFTLEQVDDWRDKLTIYLTCSKVTMHLLRTITHDILSEKIVFDLTDPKGKSISCENNRTIRWSGVREHYNCDRQDNLGCRVTDNNDTIKLSLGSFEFEINGQEENIKNKIWSSKKTNCGRIYPSNIYSK